MPLGLCYQLHREIILLYNVFEISVAMWVILNNCTSTPFFFFFLNIKLTICCTVNLITTCLSPLTATRECLIYNTPLCLHFPPLGYSHTVGSWHGYHIAQMVTSCAVHIQNLVVSLLHEGWEISRIVKYTNRHPQLPDIDHVSSATNKILQEIVRNISGWKYPRSNTHSL